MKKKLLALGLAGMMMLGAFAGCGSDTTTPPADDTTGGSASTGDAAGTDDPAGTPASGDKISVVMSMPIRDEFWTSMENKATAKAQELNVDLQIYESQYDFTQQMSHVTTAQVNGADAVIVGLVNNDSAQEIIDAAGDMKVVFVNRQPDLSVLKDNEVVYVGTDETLYGNEQGKFLAEYFKAQNKTDINIVVLMGELGLDNVIKRTQSVKDSLAENGINATVVYEDTAQWDRAKAMDKFTQFMGTGTAFDAVICNNDEMALGCIEALNASGKAIDFPIVGIDGTIGGCQAVKDGTMACTVLQDQGAQGEGVIICASGLVRGEPIDNLTDNYYNIPPELITPENVDNYLG